MDNQVELIKCFLEVVLPILIPLAFCYFTKNIKKIHAKVVMVSLIIFIFIIFKDGNQKGPINDIKDVIEDKRGGFALVSSMLLFTTSIITYLREVKQKKL